MLHFTETSPTLPDILQVNEQFEREYDSDEFEVKIAGLLKRARHRDRELLATGDGQWNDAIAALKDEDHYILVIAYAAFPDYRKTLRPTHRIRDYVLYVLIALGLVGAVIAIAVWRR